MLEGRSNALAVFACLGKNFAFLKSEKRVVSHDHPASDDHGVDALAFSA